MALFIDQSVSEVSDLTGYEANLPEVSAAEGIHLDTKLRLAHTEVAAQLEAATRRPGNIYLANGSAWQSSGGDGHTARVDLSQVVVTPPLKLLHTFQTLSLIYRDAYNRKLNDKYLPKWREYKELAQWAWDLLLQTGVGITVAPVQRPVQPQLDWVSSSLDLTVLFVRMTWIGIQSAEGAGSIEQAISIPTGNALRVTPPTAPSGLSGWNVYVAETSGKVTRQNAAPLEVDTAWVMLSTGVQSGEPLGMGQEPDFFKTVPRFLQRG